MPKINTAVESRFPPEEAKNTTIFFLSNRSSFQLLRPSVGWQVSLHSRPPKLPVVTMLGLASPAPRSLYVRTCLVRSVVHYVNKLTTFTPSLTSTCLLRLRWLRQLRWVYCWGVDRCLYRLGSLRGTSPPEPLAPVQTSWTSAIVRHSVPNVRSPFHNMFLLGFILQPRRNMLFQSVACSFVCHHNVHLLSRSASWAPSKVSIMVPDKRTCGPEGRWPLATHQPFGLGQPSAGGLSGPARAKAEQRSREPTF